jgi:exodeoxyribonuclease V alpha subunit
MDATPLLVQAMTQTLMRHLLLEESQVSLLPFFLEAMLAAESQGHACLILEDPHHLAWLSQHPAVDEAGAKPLVLTGNRLYFQRTWSYEQELAQSILERVHGPRKVSPLPKECPYNEGSDQAKAWHLALSAPFCIITGGPGTGKTSIVRDLMPALLKQNPSLVIKLAAPTGKAANRLKESLASRPSEEWHPQMPKEASTLHQLLGAKPHQAEFHYHRGNPLPADCLIIDEASMVDLPMMAKVLNALSPHSRLILLGDKDQLHSVEVGAVFGELCESLPHNTQVLHHTYRFHGTIAALAKAINRLDHTEALRLLRTSASDDSLAYLTPGGLEAAAIAGYQTFHDLARQRGVSAQEAFHAFDQFQVLCAQRKGPQGVEHVNQVLTRHFHKNLFSTWYPGRPILFTQNQYSHQLFNGDIGLCLEDAAGHLRVMVRHADGAMREFAPGILSGVETAYALTIHKSQGSEYDEVLLALPEQNSPVLSKALLYTGLTRAKRKVTVCADEQLFLLAIRESKRHSGLSLLLKNLDPP